MKTFPVNRRAFLGGLVAASGAAAAACFAGERSPARPFFSGHGLPLGLQLYTLGEAPYRDLEGTLQAVARIGYRTVETVGLMKHTAAALRAALDRAGLACPSAHVPIQPAGPGPTLSGDLGSLAADMHRIGARYVVVPILPVPPRFGQPQNPKDGIGFLSRVARQMTADDWRRTAQLLNERGAALKRQGLRLAYHNHNIEFVQVGSKSGYELLLENTQPDSVWFEMDVGWVAAAGVDPLPLLRAHRGRFRLLHIKDLEASTVPNHAFRMQPADVGAGSLDWKAILPVAYAAGVRDFYVEQEPPFPVPRLQAARADYDYLARLNEPVRASTGAS
jgi:sugar phosphate isomerase/epimerase